MNNVRKSFNIEIFHKQIYYDKQKIIIAFKSNNNMKKKNLKNISRKKMKNIIMMLIQQTVNLQKNLRITINGDHVVKMKYRINGLVLFYFLSKFIQKQQIL